MMAIEFHNFTAGTHILPWLNHGCANHLALVMVPSPFHDVANEFSTFGRILSSHLQTEISTWFFPSIRKITHLLQLLRAYASKSSRQKSRRNREYLHSIVLQHLSPLSHQHVEASLRASIACHRIHGCWFRPAGFGEALRRARGG